MTKKYTVASLFSGAGGLDLGLEGGFVSIGKKYKKRPFEIIWANDDNERACKTLALNFSHTTVACQDILEVLKNPKLLPPADVVVGGFPCQDFSLSGKRGGLTVKRGQLYLSMVKAIKHLQPKIFLAENVKGLVSWQQGLGIRTMIKDFEALGYNVEYKILNAADYGVPQNRERVIIIGKRKDLDGEIVWPEPTTSNKKVTLKQAIGDLEDDRKHFCLPNAGYSKAKLFPGTQGNSVTSADKPGPTMRAEHHGNIEFHYALPRRLSAREAARIQSFPDDFVFLQSTSDAYRQIGNAVPPVLAWHLAGSLEKMLQREET